MQQTFLSRTRSRKRYLVGKQELILRQAPRRRYLLAVSAGGWTRRPGDSGPCLAWARSGQRCPAQAPPSAAAGGRHHRLAWLFAGERHLGGLGARCTGVRPESVGMELIPRGIAPHRKHNFQTKAAGITQTQRMMLICSLIRPSCVDSEHFTVDHITIGLVVPRLPRWPLCSRFGSLA